MTQTGRIVPIRQALFAQFPRLRDWGTQNCRKISGSSSWSQHAWSNANDAAYPAGGNPRNDPYLNAAVAWLKEQKRLGTRFGPDGVRIGTILYQNGPDTTQGHWDHVHYEADPRQTGTPPCAGGTPTPDPEEDEMAKTTEGIQRTLNAHGYTDQDGKPLKVDGIWGSRTEYSFGTMVADAAAVDDVGGAVYYTVQAGDSLRTIADAHDTTTAALIALNPQIPNPDVIHPGDVIRVR